MKKREEINEKYKWNLDEYSLNIQDCYTKLKELQPKFNIFEKYRGKLNEPNAIFSCLEASRPIEIELGKKSTYARLRLAENSDNTEVKELNDFVSSILEDYSLKTNFIEVELSKLDDNFLSELENNKKYPHYKRFFNLLNEQKKHILSEKEEDLLTKIGVFTGGFSETFDMFDSLDVKFEPAVDSKGKKYDLNHSTRSKLIMSADPMLRKTAYVNYLKGYEKSLNTISTCYINSVKEDCVFAKIKKYDNALSSALITEEIKPAVYNTLIKKVNDNVSIIHNYIDALKTALNLSDMTLADFDAPITNKTPIKNMPYEQAIEIVFDALKPLGQDYLNILNTAKTNNWIDVFANVGKDTGQFSASSYGAHPIVSLRYEGNYDSVTTIAHELGHAVHSYYSKNKQPYEVASYPIFLAEIASTTNEVLLNDYLIKNAKTEDEKLFYLKEFLGMVQGTIFRQTQFAEFEELAHKKYETDKILTKEYLNEEFKKLNNKYYGNNIKKFEQSNIVWSYIPHFYSSFYVYKYATGLISAIKIASGILNNKPNAKENYIKFLSSGGSLPPLETLKATGVDLENEKTFDEAFDFINSKLDEFKKLSKKKAKTDVKAF